MNIKEAEKATGVSVRNIRFYEQKGLLAPARNQENDYRDYSDADIQRLQLIRAVRTLLGLSENAVDVFVMEEKR